MIEIKDLCKSYENKRIYEHLNLIIPEKEISCIIGPSGCGKTTLLRILAGLESYDAGEISGLEQQKVSFVFQEDRLMPWLSVEENITYVLGHLSETEKEKKLSWVLDMMQLNKDRKSSVQSLSGGMKRRAAMARALVYESSLLLLDEPFNGLDDTLKWEILSKLIVYWKEKAQTVVVVTHDQEVALKLGHIIEINNVRSETER